MTNDPTVRAVVETLEISAKKAQKIADFGKREVSCLKPRDPGYGTRAES
jgi:hypothetical protein